MDAEAEYMLELSQKDRSWARSALQIRRRPGHFLPRGPRAAFDLIAVARRCY
jgi:hypothetical protein